MHQRDSHTREIIQRAFNLQRMGELEQAAALYRGALAHAGDDPDCLHMLGVVYLRQKKYLQGVECIKEAYVAGGWRHSHCVANLLRGLEQLVGALPEPAHAPKKIVMAQRAKRAAAISRERTPLVSVCIPSHNHARFIRHAIQSAYAQTYAAIELIVIDDGSADATAQIIHDELSRCPVPSQFIRRENRGAATTINECIALASSRYVNVLNSDDAFTPNRIEEMVRAIHQSGAEWGFSRCTVIGEDGNKLPDDDDRAAKIQVNVKFIDDIEHTSHHFIAGNPAISSGNIFASKELIERIGGFRNLRYTHDWAFCLDALWHSEPVMVDAELYCYRVHGANTISESGSAAAQEALAITGRYCDRAETEAPPNVLALCRTTYPAQWRLAKLRQIVGFAASRETVRELIAEICDEYRRRCADPTVIP